MPDDFYIPRTLESAGRNFTEVELLENQGVIVVLAEPGAGKTDLLKSFAAQLGVVSERASIFKERSNITQVENLILDAFDEVAKLDQTAVDRIVVRARETEARRVILASRSSEWEEARSKSVEECFGKNPIIIKLLPLDELQQRAIFENHVPSEDFELFKSEVGRFDLLPLLGNPQFLKLFADSFVEGGRKFTSKNAIFQDAVSRLAQEANPSAHQKNRPPISHIVSLAQEVFAKLLLSGADGVGVAETHGDRQYPKLTSLFMEPSEHVFNVIDSRLFKPAASENKHEPVHRIVAEYCAAKYLSSRLDSSSDLLSLRRCLSIIAPNNVVRDELRGLVGWLAAVGCKETQEAIIAIDSYAVLANGDPSMLLASSRRKLLCRLRETANTDPHFRRGDTWRTFSAAGFFTPEILDEFKHEIVSPNDSVYRDLLLELLESSGAAGQLADELRELLLGSSCSLNTRLLAHQNLLTIDYHDHRADCMGLIDEGSQASLSIAAKLFLANGVHLIGRDALLSLLESCSGLYFDWGSEAERFVVGERYFINELVQILDFEAIVWLLDKLAPQVVCKCGADDAYACNCRTGVSKVVGRLLDQYFKLRDDDSNDAAILWSWMKGLNFHESISLDTYESVVGLRANTKLRQEIHRLAFEGIIDAREADEVRYESLGDQSHGGMHLLEGDSRVIVNRAYEEGNVGLWASFFPHHNIYSKEHKRNSLRFHMRQQADGDSAFMGAWMRNCRSNRIDNKRRRVRGSYRHSRRYRKRSRRQSEIRAENFQHLQDNRSAVERGEHFGWLKIFAQRYLRKAESLKDVVDDEALPERALANGISFIEKNLPSLSDLVEAKRSFASYPMTGVLHASCLVIYRRTGSLASISKDALSILKATKNSCHPYNQKEENRFDEELNFHLFKGASDVEAFAQNYLEPLLVDCHEDSNEVARFVDKPEFASLFPARAFKWLELYPMMPKEALKKLFSICALNMDRGDLIRLIRCRCQEFEGTSWDESDERLKFRRTFWYIRYFFFVNEDLGFVVSWLGADPDLLFEIERLSGSYGRDECASAPYLTASKVFLVLDCYAQKWPKVDLPDSWGSNSSTEENAYRFLRNVLWHAGRDESDQALDVLGRIIDDSRLIDFKDDALAIRAKALREVALRDFQAPTPSAVVAFIDDNQLTTVEDFRSFLIEQLEEYQGRIDGGEFDLVDVFYANGVRVDEPTACKRVASDLSMRLGALSMSVSIEHQLKDAKRCDITAGQMLEGRRRLVVIEAKGQWHKDLFSAAKVQLYERYSIHQDAEHQGIYLVFWFGADEKIAGKNDASINSAGELKDRIVEEMPEELRNCIDVFVLDLSR